MVVAQNKVVLIHYTLKDDAGNVIDSSSGREPLATSTARIRRT